MRQEYYCEFGSTEDALFESPLADFFPNVNPASPNQYLVVGYDPARKQDRSGLTFLHVNPHERTPITSIASEAIPNEHKVTYEKQALYIKSRIEEF